MSNAKAAVQAPGSDCSLSITGEKRKAVGEYITKLGPQLRQRYGPRKHYTPSQVRQTAADGAMQLDYLCFAYCLYCSPSDFALIHAAAGEACDYAAMHSAIGATFFHGETAFEGGGLAELVWSITGGVADGASVVGNAAWDAAGTVGEVAGGVVGGVFELLGGAADVGG